jgi:hypothetical protein
MNPIASDNLSPLEGLGCQVHAHLIMIHDIIPGFLILPTFQGHRGQKFKTASLVGKFCCYLTWSTF